MFRCLVASETALRLRLRNWSFWKSLASMFSLFKVSSILLWSLSIILSWFSSRWFLDISTSYQWAIAALPIIISVFRLSCGLSGKFKADLWHSVKSWLRIALKEGKFIRDLRFLNLPEIMYSNALSDIEVRGYRGSRVWLTFIIGCWLLVVGELVATPSTKIVS